MAGVFGHRSRRRTDAGAWALLHLGLVLKVCAAGRGGLLYPWKTYLEEVKPALWFQFAKGCPPNATILGLKTYQEYFTALPKRSYNQAELRSLAGRHQERNRHLLVCPLAVLKTVQLLVLTHMRSLFALASDEDGWHIAWREIEHAREIWMMLEPLMMHPTGDSVWYDKVTAYADRYKVSMVDWITNEIHSLQARIAKMQNVGLGIWNVAGSHEGAYPVEKHRTLLKTAKTLLDKAKDLGLISAWVVARGSLVTALRYGENAAPVLPSGFQEADAWDVDSYVLTSKWTEFFYYMVESSEDHGIDWCGWREGWPHLSMQCISGTAELEVHSIDKRAHDGVPIDAPPHALTMSMLPTSPCRGAMATGEDAEIALPCPRDPLGFMLHLWKGNPKYTACLAMPIARNREAHPVTEEDVRFLWQRALELQAAGYLHFGAYFAHCKDHPHEELIKSLYWKDNVIT
eukprot:TRINITY_DN21316_c0_g1_i1.p1 TRINITY_DN21316_c0_g1~~TRINITY_DN21316_c0_g1_i1.p1  ORF type:complete len:459 (+),score=56.36 TRINITY_DN21316_c0_g1_i1:255-1631(+)